LASRGFISGYCQAQPFDLNNISSGWVRRYVLFCLGVIQVLLDEFLLFDSVAVWFCWWRVINKTLTSFSKLICLTTDSVPATDEFGAVV
jgi:hypothetical protein